MDERSGRPTIRQRRRHAPAALVVAVQLADASWLNVQTQPQPAPGWALPTLVTLGLTAGLVGLGVVLAVRRATRPMTRLAVAADALGRGEALPPLPEAGPADVRATVQAFNRMQARLRRFVDDRTRMLAAIGHDLRTPITSLRLRAEFVEDEDTRSRILATLDEMQNMVEGTLAFARQDAADEPTRTVDLSALVESTVLDLADLGAEVTFAEGRRQTLRCRPVALRRALRNLIENAVRYGTRCRVRIEGDRHEVRILVEDDGPGIPEAEQERVFEPFVRLEGSRSSQTGGIGLGLAIARSIVRAHGGDIRLANRPGGGLAVTVALPAPPPRREPARTMPGLGAAAREDEIVRPGRLHANPTSAGPSQGVLQCTITVRPGRGSRKRNPCMAAMRCGHGWLIAPAGRATDAGRAPTTDAEQGRAVLADLR